MVEKRCIMGVWKAFLYDYVEVSLYIGSYKNVDVDYEHKVVFF